MASAPNDATSKVRMILDFIFLLSQWWIGSTTPLGIGCGIDKVPAAPP
jgi:hypothetical protein